LAGDPNQVARESPDEQFFPYAQGACPKKKASSKRRKEGGGEGSSIVRRLKNSKIKIFEPVGSLGGLASHAKFVAAIPQK